MNAIGKAVADIRARIPKALLEKGFINRFQGWNSPIDNNVDKQITDLVIKSRVLSDCDLVGGSQITISLEGLMWNRPDANTSVVKIPKERTQGRSITSIVHVGYLNISQLGAISGAYAYSNGLGSGTMDNTALNSLMTSVVNAVDHIPITTTANVELIAENTILIRDMVNIPNSAYLVCMIANQENMGDLHPRSIPAFSQLCVLATKAYLYNTLIIEMDTAELQGGFQLGTFKSILESYSDADQAYLDYLNTTWRKTAFINDKPTWRRFIKMNVGGVR